MFNYFLDRLPDEFEGYLIRTDFRIAVQIMLCFEDPDLSQTERIETALSLLYGNGIPDIEKAYEGLIWFLNCGKEPDADREDVEKFTDFDIDSPMMYTAFKKNYQIDLKKDKLHWWDFNALLGDLGECAYTNVVKIRTKDLSECSSADERRSYKKLKKQFKLPNTLSEEEREAIERFRELSGEDIEME